MKRMQIAQIDFVIWATFPKSKEGKHELGETYCFYFRPADIEIIKK